MGQAYKVLSIDELSRVAEAGGIEKYYRHKIKTRGGTVLTVDIGEADMDEAKVEAILEAKATLFDKIKAH